jgi:hypothetical protein
MPPGLQGGLGGAGERFTTNASDLVDGIFRNHDHLLRASKGADSNRTLLVALQAPCHII